MSAASGFARLGLVALSMLAPVGAWSRGEAVDGAADGASLAEQRQAVEARFQAESVRCAERFDVNRCLEEARARRRLDLQAVREQEMRQAERQRQSRAQARREAVAAKAQAAAARAASAAASAASAPPSGPRR